MGSHEGLIYIIPFILFFTAYFGFSQKIYFYNRFLHAFIAALLITAMMFLVSKKENYNKAILSGAILFFYILLLWLIRKKYELLNNFFVKKQWIGKEFENKDFTWVEISEEGGIWDKKIATKPSTLDYMLSLVLLIAPMPLAIGLTAVTSFLF